MTRTAAFHVAAEAELLRQCAASGQLSASQVHAHEMAGELPITMEDTHPTTDPDELHRTLCDARSGWRYIRETHGDLYGVGWDRVERRLDAQINESAARLKRDPGSADPLMLLRLQREIADEACRVDIECHALGVPSSYPHPVYDVSQLEPGHPNDDEMAASDQQAIDRAVRYLDMRGLLARPIAGQANYVSFGRA